MMALKPINSVLQLDCLKGEHLQGDHYGNSAALPDSALTFLEQFCREYDVRSVFEFGSGRSTKHLLSRGYIVTSLEDSPLWMSQTVGSLDEEEAALHRALVRPLSRTWIGGFPVLDWHLDEELVHAINDADLILIDSPSYPPFRESTLRNALKTAKGVYVIIDDLRIPTVRRFCEKIAASSDNLAFLRVGIGHDFGVFLASDSTTLRLQHSFVDIAKGWVRYFKALRFYSDLRRRSSI
jgi:hypothetical protein